MDLEKISAIIPVNWPDERGIYKIVQVDAFDRSFLRFPCNNFEDYHCSILRRFLEETGLRYKCMETKASDSRFRIPETFGDEYMVRGMGKASIDIDGKNAIFFGASFDYELDIDKEHIDRIRLKVPDWSLQVRDGF